MSKLIKGFVVGLSLIVLGGCSLFPSRPPELLVDHDFGPIQTRAFEKPGVPVLIHVKGLSWLAGTSIHYRLLYRDPTAVYAYADNRWIAPPAALLKARLRARLGLGTSVTAGPPPEVERLVLVLSRFDQNFSTPHKAFVRLAIQGRLYNVTTGRLLATKTVNLKRACAPSVTGAVEGLGALARRADRIFVQLVRRHTLPEPKDSTP